MQLNAIGIVVALVVGLLTPAPLPESVSIAVPFFTQAPTGDWSDLRQKQGCEEATALMAVAWARGQTFILSSATAVIVDASDYEEKQYGSYIDTSAADTAQRIFKEYFNYQNVSVAYDIGPIDIKQALADGSLVIVPIDGTRLGNHWYTQQPGPPRHMILVHGYDSVSSTFIVNDPGTSHGKDYVIPEAVLAAALHDYPSSAGDSGTLDRTAMIIIKKL